MDPLKHHLADPPPLSKTQIYTTHFGPPRTILYIEENFLCINELKVKFTLSFLTLDRLLETLEKNFAAKRFKGDFYKIDFDLPPPPLLRPPGGPTLPTYVLRRGPLDSGVWLFPGFATSIKRDCEESTRGYVALIEYEVS